MHNLEPRGYVVGWIIAISLLVGILIFLLLAVLLWKVSLVIVGGPTEPPPIGAQSSCLTRGKFSWKKFPLRTFFMVQVQWRKGRAPCRL